MKTNNVDDGGIILSYLISLNDYMEDYFFNQTLGLTMVIWWDEGFFPNSLLKPTIVVYRINHYNNNVSIIRGGCDESKK